MGGPWAILSGIGCQVAGLVPVARWPPHIFRSNCVHGVLIFCDATFAAPNAVASGRDACVVA
eukprot:8053295-Karenia_brevis.AAC.1